MKQYWPYLKYVIRHKWHVMIACFTCFKCYLFWRGIMHDMSKFRLSEFIAYANYFYGKKKDPITGSKRVPFDKDDIEFNKSWLFHLHRNKHHWQYWILQKDNGNKFCLDMPDKYILEMLCDWYGAGRALKSKISTREWYEQNENKMLISDITRINIHIWLRIPIFNKVRGR